MKRRWLWLAGLAVYAAFFWWYTNTGGPLDVEEVAEFAAAMRDSGGTPERIANLRRFMAEDDGRQFLMVNVLHLADNPPPVSGAPPGESASELLDRYMAYMYPAMFSRASHPVFAGSAVFGAMDLAGFEDHPHAGQWTDAALVRYRSRRDLMEIALNPEFGDRHPFKLAALEKTIAFPVSPNLYLSDGRLVLLLLLLPIVMLIDRLYPRRDDGQIKWS